MYIQKLSTEILGSCLLFGTAIIAIIISNSSLNTYYQMLDKVYFTLSLGIFTINKNLAHWINDGLMSVYFLCVGLGIKREFYSSILTKKSNIVIPAIIALFGMLIPSVIYILINFSYPRYINGWTIATTTDIAFTLGILGMLGPRVPGSLKILVTIIAIFDDIAAILIIAILYTQKLSLIPLIILGLCLSLLIFINQIKIKNLMPYVLIGIIMWMTILKAGVHATLAGIILAVFIPHSEKKSPLLKLEHKINLWSVFIILPLFALVNANIDFKNISIAMIFHPISLGIILGLFLGKQLGIFFSLYFFSKIPCFTIGKDLSTGHLYGIGLVCGIGFTMSLFLGNLAFSQQEYMNMVKIGVLTASFISAVSGYFFLKLCSTQPRNR